jgi:hypothetical protein
MAYHRQARRARQYHADLPAVARPGAQPGRERLAVSSPELALKHRLRKLRRHRRRRLQRVAKAHCRARQNHIHRNARLGSRRSVVMTFGISNNLRHLSGGLKRKCRQDFSTELTVNRFLSLKLRRCYWRWR